MTLICPTKVIIKSINTIRRKYIRKKDLTKLCTKLTAKLVMTAYKSNILKLKVEEDPLQLRIYFLDFIKLLEMVISQYKET